MKIELSKIRIDGGTQQRAEINQSIVAEYADAIISGATFPPVTVFHDGADYWLADGFHRFHAAKRVSAEIEADVKVGDLRAAKLHSFGANASHGLRRSNADKRKSVEGMLADDEWAAWSNYKIAQTCGVSEPFVAAVRSPEVAAKQAEARGNSAAKMAATTNPISSPPTNDRAENNSELAKTVAHGKVSLPAAVEQVAGKRPSAKPRPEAAGEPAHTEEPDHSEAEETAIVMRELAEEVETLRAKVVAREEGADVAIDNLREQIRKLEAENETLRISRDWSQTKCSEMLKQCKFWEREARKRGYGK